MADVHAAAAAIRATMPAPGLRVRYGVVQSINALAGTVTVTIGGSTTSVAVRYLDSYNPTEGDTVVIIVQDNRCEFVLGTLA